MAAKSKAKKTAPKKKSASAKATKYVYTWGAGKADGHGGMKPLLGGKGANLAEMTRIGLPVPPGFTVTTEVCTYFYAHKKTYPKELQAQMEAGVANMEKIMGTKFGATDAMPLLVAVRSGARDSMPGMMDTILNLGLNDQTVVALEKATGNARFAWDCYRRFIQMYGDVVLGVQKRPDEDHEPFETAIHNFKHEKYHQDIVDSELTAADQAELVKRFKALVLERTGKGFPNDPWEQLRGAAGAVFGSWMNDRAKVYRAKYNIPSEWGTAVNVQAMVFGNTGETSGSGVAFTRNPANGTNEFYGEFLINAQGEDVVAGVRTPEPVLELKKQMPKSYAELLKVRATLEKHFKDVQDIEFTIQDGKLFMLQTRNGKRTAAAALKFSIDMVKEEPHRLEDCHPAQPGRPAGAAPRPDLRARRGEEGQGDRDRPARGSRRRHRQDLLQRRTRRCRRREGRKGPPRTRRDLARGSPRHDRRRGHPHRPRRRVLARRARRPPDGQGLRVRRRRPPHRLRQDRRCPSAARSTTKATSSRSTARPAPFTAARSRPLLPRSSPAS
jgi:pyruvate,orthophosphate dikinase